MQVSAAPFRLSQKIAYLSDRASEQIFAHAKGLPEGTPVAARGLLHLGNRAAVDQALSPQLPTWLARSVGKAAHG
ncbi:MAG: hypothetical protein E5V67_02445 [Mesorhizobium sp.]|nr:MAG: hypothetical protein EOS41_24905 [Mesorhizobium sp.]TGQ21346.1 hypothetical protein EN860_014705 [Mesorhizobium sp. M00.F.Ca.ET.217.01.1.1]TGV84145.1 hypothetical protein EN801_031285 [Mesorhizobium sp. M00.F.Ca.ET.158.01.1.1]TKB44177.1 MAG: hypothetical protein E5V67_02445 [Mesorhizobium sp.]